MPTFKGLEHEEKTTVEPRDVVKRALMIKEKRYQGCQGAVGSWKRWPPVVSKLWRSKRPGEESPIFSLASFEGAAPTE